MITEEQYKQALTIVDQYRKQLSLSVVSGSPKIDVYEWIKSEMMVTTDITLDEFEEVLQIWVRQTRKNIEADKLVENYR
jgi:sulfatase maturation enzyme AslB (radical SAM superfamily)